MVTLQRLQPPMLVVVAVAVVVVAVAAVCGIGDGVDAILPLLPPLASAQE